MGPMRQHEETGSNAGGVMADAIGSAGRRRVESKDLEAISRTCWRRRSEDESGAAGLDQDLKAVRELSGHSIKVRGGQERSQGPGVTRSAEQEPAWKPSVA